MKNEEFIFNKKRDRFKTVVYLLMISQLLFILPGCSEKNNDENVDIFLVENGVKVINSTSSEIGYFAVDQNILAVLTWAPICGDDNVISAGTSKVIEFSSILGYGTSNTILVHYWQCPREDGDEINNTIIEID